MPVFLGASERVVVEEQSLGTVERGLFRVGKLVVWEEDCEFREVLELFSSLRWAV